MKQIISKIPYKWFIIFILLLPVFLSGCGSNMEIWFICDGAKHATCELGSNIVFPEEPTKEGYVFDGWYFDENIWKEPLTLDTLSNIPLDKNIMVYAKWIDSSGVFGTDIRLDVLTKLDDGTYYFKVDNSVTTFDFSNLVTVYPLSTWELSDSIQVNNIIKSYTVSLQEGNNYFYILVTDNKTKDTELYTINIHRREMITVTFYLIDDKIFERKTVEEDGYVDFSIPTRTNYEFVSWDYDKTIPITKPISIYAKWTPVNYKVKFMSNGEIVKEEYIPYLNSINYIIEREFFSFDGWYTETNYTNKAETVTKDMIVYAKWKPLSYRIICDLNGGKGTAYYTYTYDDEFVLVPPTKDYYNFIGWEYEGVIYNEVKIHHTGNDKNYKAIYEPINYTISYELNGGVCENPETYTIEDTFILNNPEKKGYVFKCWYDGISEYSSLRIFKQNGNRKYIAIYEIIVYNIITILNGGTVTSNPSTYTIDDVITLNNPEKIGYDFLGWDSGDGVITKNVSIENEIDNKTYTAIYNPIEYTIDYDLNNGTINNKTTYTIEDTFSLKPPTKRGYDFTGWTGTNLTSVTYEVIISNQTGNLNYEAHYSPIEYYLSYRLNGGLETSNPMTYTIEDKITLNNPVKLGYTFIGWTTPSSDTLRKEVRIENEINDLEFIANYSVITYTIGYNLYGGSVSENPKEYNITDVFTLNNPTKRGYIFTGWSSLSLPKIYNPCTIRMLTGNIIFDANYEAIDYNITYDLNGGINNPKNKTIYNITDEITLYEPSKPGYRFTGWTYNGVNIGKSVSFNNQIGDKTYIANYEVINYSISYNLDGGDCHNIDTYTINDQFTLNNPVKKGYTFIGWKSNLYSGTKMEVSITNTYQNISFTACYNAIVYSITYNMNGAQNSEQNKTSYTIQDTITLVNPVFPGKEFIGWKEEGTDSTILNLTFANEIGNKKFNAIFKNITYNITYNLNGGEAQNLSTYTYDDKVILNNPVKKHYDFIGWTTPSDSNLKMEVSFINTYGNKEYIANYKLTEYNITYNLLDGKGSNPLTYTYLDTFTLNNPTCDGREFIGWSGTDIDGVQMSVSIDKKDKDLVFNANYKTLKYTISYRLNGGVLPYINKTQYTIDDTFTVTNPTRDGYRFIGWTGTDITSPVMTLKIEHMFGNRSYYANYEAINYDITYVTNNGSYNLNNQNTRQTGVINDSTYTLSYTKETSNSIIIPTNVVSNNYPEYVKFLGWYLDKECTNPFINDLGTNNRNITLYAKWDSYSIYNSILTTPDLYNGQYIVDWSNETILDVTAHSRTTYSLYHPLRDENIDIGNNVSKVIFIGKADSTYTNLSIHLASIEKDTNINIVLDNFNFISCVDGAIKSWNEDGIEKGMFLTITNKGSSSIKTNYSGGTIIKGFTNMKINGNGELSFIANDSSNSDGGDAINVNNLEIDFKGTLVIAGGNGGNGANGISYDRTYNPLGTNLDGRPGGNGTAGGNGGSAIKADRINIYNASNLTLSLHSGSGGNGGNGGNGEFAGYNKNPTAVAGNGGIGGSGGNAGILITTDNIVTDSPLKKLNINFGNSGKGGNGGNGGHSDHEYFIVRIKWSNPGYGGNGGGTGNINNNVPNIERSVQEIVNGTEGGKGDKGDDGVEDYWK